jgi:hypothetical protein
MTTKKVDDADVNYLLHNPPTESSSVLMMTSVAQGQSLSSSSLYTYTHGLTNLTGAVKTDFSNEHCDVSSFTWRNYWEQKNGGATGQNIDLKLVYNKKYQTLAATLPTGAAPTVTDYQNYIGKVHERFLSKPVDGDSAHKWRGWNHWLDQHVGVKYAGSTLIMGDDDEFRSMMQASCVAQGAALNAEFLNDHTLVGKRFIQEDGDHYYTGYSSSSMAIEFNTECHYGAKGTSDICMCNPQNSDYLAVEEQTVTGVTYEKCDYIYENEDGHVSAEGPWDGEAYDGNPA